MDGRAWEIEHGISEQVTRRAMNNKKGWGVEKRERPGDKLKKSKPGPEPSTYISVRPLSLTQPGL